MNQKCGKKSISTLLALVLFLGLFQGLSGASVAQAEPVPLKRVVSVTSSPKEAKVGDKVSVTLDLDDRVTGVSGELEAGFSSLEYESSYRFTLAVGSDGFYHGSVTIDETAKSGTYILTNILIPFADGSFGEIYNLVLDPELSDSEDLSGADFIVSNPNQDIAPPVVTAVSVDKTSVLQGETVNVTVQASDVGLGIDGSIMVDYEGPDLGHQDVALTSQGNGTYTGQLILPKEAPAGTWFISQISLKDKGCNRVVLHNATRGPRELQTMKLDHCDITVNYITPPDTTPPVIESLTISHNKVSYTNGIIMTVRVSDDQGLKGDVTGSYAAPDWAMNTLHKTFSFSLREKSPGVYEGHPALGSAIGTYILDYVSISDMAGNETRLENVKLNPNGTDLTQYDIRRGYDIVFDSMGGTVVPNQFTSNGYLAEPAPPTRENYSFAGWYHTNTYERRWDFAKDKANEYTQSLYAKWIPAGEPVEVPEFPYYAKVTATSLNFRSGPSTWYSTQSSIPKGTIVKVNYRDNNWYFIEHLGKKGYVSVNYLQKIDSALVYQVNPAVNMRTGPSTAYSIIRKLPIGTLVELVSKPSTTWYQILAGTTKGFVSVSYLKPVVDQPAPTPPPEPADTTIYLVKTAVNLRSGPSTANTIIHKMPVGTLLQQLQKVNDTWWQVKYDQWIGYVSAKYLVGIVTPVQRYITLEPINLRTGPSTSYSVITKLPRSSVFIIIKKTSSTWWQVYVDGKIGYVYAKNLHFMP
ncbi:SH3 domain-containing protein [Clostridiaceae bacterium HFYG-1003]|nr:SH3 domain-containing protein [Clostridiaceae bacterium HFYG-1003]